MAAHQRLLAIILLLGILAGGCRNTSPPTTVSTSRPPSSNKSPQVDRPQADAHDPSEPVDPSGPHAQAIEALTRKTSSHAQSMEELLARRGAEPRELDPSDSAVQWRGPDDASDKANSSIATDDIDIDEPQANVSLPLQPDPEGASPTTHRADTGISANASAAVTTSPAPAQRQPHDDIPQVLPPEADHDLPLPRDRAHTDLLHERLARHIREYPRDTAGHLEYQLLQFLRGEQVPQLSAISSLPAEDRELLVALLDGLSNFRSTLRSDNNMLLSRKVRPLLQMSDRLRTQADLHIPTIALCTRVDGFGVYEPIEPARFIAGREQPVIIYCEVQNFSSQMGEDRRWETRLAHEAVLYTESGMNIWQEPTHTVTDRSRNRRHDFFVVKLVRLPANLSIGQYVLKVTIRDEHAARVAEASLPIQIVSR